MPRKKADVKRQKADGPEELEDVDYSVEEKARVNFEVGEHSQMGTMHPSNEDAFIVHEFDTCSFFAVIDGHSAKDQGKEASQYTSQHLQWEISKHLDTLSYEECFREAFIETDRKFSLDAEKRGSDSGCCVLACILKGRHLILGQAGDCRAIFCDSQVHQLTFDHNYQSSMSERKRVEDLGGYFAEGRIFGELEPTRGFGDVEIRRAHIDMLLDIHKTAKSKTASVEAEKSTKEEAADTKASHPYETRSAAVSSTSSTTASTAAAAAAAPPASSSMLRTSVATKRHASKLTACPVPLSYAELEALTSVTDLDPEYSIVSPLPVVVHHTVPVSEEGSFLVLASDGVWSSLTNNKVCEIVKHTLAAKHGHGTNKAKAAAQALCEAASACPLSYDDITAIVIWFKN